MTNTNRLVPCSLLIILGLLWHGAADAAERGWHLRAGVAFVDPDVSEEGIDDAGDSVSISAAGDLGYSLGLEYRFSRRVGLELGYIAADPELEITITESLSGERFRLRSGTGFSPLTLGLNLHLTPNARVDLSFQPMLAYVTYDDLRFTLGTASAEIESEDELAAGVRLGLDIPFGEAGWSIYTAVSYFDTELETRDEEGERDDFGFDPLLATVGVGHRF